MDASLSIPGDQNLLIIDVIYKTALIDQLLHEGREGLALIGLTGGLISNDTGLKINLYQIAFFDLFGCFLTFDDGKSDIDGIPIEDAGEGFSDDATNACGLDCDRSMLSGGSATEVLTGNNQISCLVLLGEVSINVFHAMFCKFSGIR